MNARLVREGYDELEREQLVRKRCYAKWVSEGKLSRTDSIDRFERMACAIYFMRYILSAQPELINKPQPAVDAPKELAPKPETDTNTPY